MSSGTGPSLAAALINEAINSNLAQQGHVFGLYTAAPAGTDDPTTNEANYGGYSRSNNLSIDNGGLFQDGNEFSNTSGITFGTCTDGGGQVITHVAMIQVYVGPVIAYWGELDEPYTTVTGVAPVLNVGQWSVTES